MLDLVFCYLKLLLSQSILSLHTRIVTVFDDSSCIFYVHHTLFIILLCFLYVSSSCLPLSLESCNIILLIFRGVIMYTLYDVQITGSETLPHSQMTFLNNTTTTLSPTNKLPYSVAAQTWTAVLERVNEMIKESMQWTRSRNTPLSINMWLRSISP